MAQGLGNPHRLHGAVAKRERDALAALPRQRCKLRACSLKAVALIESWDGSLHPACDDHAAEGAIRGYRVLRQGAEQEQKP